MIWATFEHFKNAPDVPAEYFADTEISPENWTFYKAKTPYSSCNINPASSAVLKLDEKNQTLSPVTQVCRQYALGNDLNQKDLSVPDNIKAVSELNSSVKSMLSKNNVWSNYYEIGAIWFLNTDSLKPNMALDTDVNTKGEQILIGSLKLSIASIETFTQIQSTTDNCFRCHNTMHRFPPNTKIEALPALNLNISHAFMNIYFWSQELKLKNN